MEENHVNYNYTFALKILSKCLYFALFVAYNKNFTTLLKNCRDSKNYLKLSPFNVISHLMWSFFKDPFTKDLWVNFFGDCYQSVKIITFNLAQSDQI